MNNYTPPDQLVTTLKYCRVCGIKLKYKKEFDKVEYDEMNGETLTFKYYTCPDIDKRFDDNHMPIAHTQTHSIKRDKK